MILLNTIKKLIKEKKPVSTTLVKRGEDRRRVNLGWKTERRNSKDRRKNEANLKNYEFVGLSYGGWTKTD